MSVEKAKAEAPKRHQYQEECVLLKVILGWKGIVASVH